MKKMIFTMRTFLVYGITIWVAMQSLLAQQPPHSFVTLTTSKAVKSTATLVIEGSDELKLTGLKLIKEEDQFGEIVRIYEVLDQNIKIEGTITKLGLDYFGVTNLDVSHCPSLELLQCKSCEELSVLDVSKNLKLQSLDCSQCALKSLQLLTNTNLRYLNCSDNAIKEIDLSKNSQLETLSLMNLKLGKVDLTPLKALNFCILDGMELSTLDISKNTKLVKLYVNENQLSSIDISHNEHLEELLLAKNQIKTLTLTSSSLRELYVNDNPLEKLVLKTPNLELLCAYSNLLQEIDLSVLQKLNTLSLHHNELKQLDLTGVPQLEYLWVNNNKLQKLDVTPCTPILVVECYENQLCTEACDALMHSLPQREAADECLVIVVNTPAQPDNKCTKSAVAKAIAKNWRVYDFVSSREGYPGVAFEGIEETSCRPVPRTPIHAILTEGKILFQGGIPSRVALYTIEGQLLEEKHAIGMIDLSCYPHGAYLVSFEGKTQKILY